MTKPETMTVALLGATGRVGREMLEVLASRRFPCTRLRALASHRSAGQTLLFRDEEVMVEDVERADLSGIDLALFSAGAAASRRWAPRFQEVGARVVDNSSAWRRDSNVPLVVPEVNGAVLSGDHRLVANPNCSTIQLVLALHPLDRAFGVERVVLSTYQAISGAGEKALREYRAQRDQGATDASVLGDIIHENVLPWIGSLGEAGYTDEELKARDESRKILGRPDLHVNCTCVRVPVQNAHSEAVTVTLGRAVFRDEVVAALSAAPGILVVDEPEARRFPTPRQVSGRDEVWVGRIRPDLGDPRSWNLWIVGDNLRKGAALNAVQIAEAWILDAPPPR